MHMLDRVGLPDPARQFRAYAHQLSGGMRQRVVIAMALICRPALLIADEPSTALDVTVQAQITELVGHLRAQTRMSIILITHDLAAVAEVSDRIIVMYLGKIVELAGREDLYRQPYHPYTQALLRSIPKYGLRALGERLNSIRGMVPDPFNRPGGCVFHPRCDEFIPGVCDQKRPSLVEVAPGHSVSCWAARLTPSPSGKCAPPIGSRDKSAQPDTNKWRPPTLQWKERRDDTGRTGPGAPAGGPGDPCALRRLGRAGGGVGAGCGRGSVSRTSKMRRDDAIARW